MKPTYDDIKRVLGDLDDHMVADIETSGVTVTELEEIAACLAQETDVMGELRRTLSPRAKLIFDDLNRAEAQWDEER